MNPETFFHRRVRGLEPQERILRARLGAHALHSQYDSKAISQAAREASPGSDGYWERQVDPDGTLDPAERRRRAGHAKRAHFIKLALKSAQARRRSL